MGRRFRNNRYPKYSRKSIFGSCPKWLKRFHHRLQRIASREAIRRGEEKVVPIPKSRIQNLWY